MSNNSPSPAPSYTTWRYHMDPEYKAKMIEKSCKYSEERLKNDPDYHEKRKAYWREYAKKIAEKKAQDPEQKEKQREYMRQYRLRKKAEKEMEQLTDKLYKSNLTSESNSHTDK